MGRRTVAHHDDRISPFPCQPSRLIRMAIPAPPIAVQWETVDSQPRAETVISTTTTMRTWSWACPGDDDEGLSRIHILREVDRSLARLQCNYLDLYYMHKLDPRTPLAESVRTFHGLVGEGKIRYWGVSNFSAAKRSQ